MAKVNLTQELKNEYKRLFASCEVKSSRLAIVDRIIDKAVRNKNRYEAAGHSMGIPWFVIAAIHSLESSASFTRHLHNGDPLTARTRQVPAGRPKKGNPPFTWEESARDALLLRKLDTINHWSIVQVLYELEGYNGWGYRLYHRQTLSPYLWSYTNHYVSGKYVADGKWSNSAVSQQCGAIALIKRMEQRGLITFPGELTQGDVIAPTTKLMDDTLQESYPVKPEPFSKAWFKKNFKWIMTGKR